MSIDPSSLTRITGIASGIDTDTMVKKMMAGEQAKLDKLNQSQQKDQWLSDSYRQWNTDLYTFESSTLLNAKMSSTFNTFAITSGQPNSVTASAGGGAIPGTYNIQVNQLAQPASFTGNNIVIDPTKTLGDAAQGSFQLTANTTLDLTVYNDPTNPSAGQTAVQIPINTTDKIGDIVNKINSAADSSGNSLGLQAFYDSNLQQFVVRTNSTGSSVKIDLSGNTSASSQAFLQKYLGIGTGPSVTGSSLSTPITISDGTNGGTANNVLNINLGNGVSSTIKLKAGTYSDSNSLVAEITSEIAGNQTLANNVSATANGSQITLTNPNGGSQNSIYISGDGAATIGLPPTGAGNSYTANGQNADVVFNGKEINSLASNTSTIMGISWTFKSPTVDANGNPTSTNVNISQDVDTEVKNIENFINSYNDILSKLNAASNEPVYSDYPPLTDAQKSSMSDTQITEWEAKAKSGLLHGDSTISGLINNMRDDMTSTVKNGSQYNSLASIGIESQSYTDQGKLTVDETKLRAAIQADPQGVQNLFNQIGSTSDGTNGLLNSLSEHFSQAVQSLTDKAGMPGASQYDQSTIGKLLTGLQTQVSTETDTYNQKETQYYNQFSAMEQAMSKYTSQSSWLTGMLSSGSAG